jgi:hypothetical protein
MSDNGYTANWPSDNYDQLGELAKQVVIRTMQEGEATHPANDFMDRHIEEHIKHARKHIGMAWGNIVYSISGINARDELEHVLARVTILLAKMEERK